LVRAKKTFTVCVVFGTAALVVVPRSARAQLPPAPTQEQEPSEEARKYFQIGVELLQDPDGARYEEALKSFKHAYELSPSWKMLSNLGLSALKLERDTEAIEAYERYLSSGGTQIDPAEHEQIQRDLEIMKNSAGSVTLHVKDGSAATITDTRQRSVGGPVVNEYQLAPNAPLTLRLVAGHHSLVVSSADKQAKLELEVSSDTRRDQEVTLAVAAPSLAPQPVSSPPLQATPAGSQASPLRTAGLIVGGVGVAALVGGTITGILGASKQSSLNDKCPDHTCTYHSAAEQSSFQSDKDSLKTLGTATTALLIGGGVLAATGITLFVAGSSKREQVSLVTSFGPFGGSIAARGAF
jgi:hypothetical protein